MKMTCFFAILFLFFFSNYSYSSSYVPLTPFEASSSTLVINNRTFLLPRTATSNVPSVGTASNYFFRRGALARIGTTAGLATALMLGYEFMRDYVSRHPSEYPTLFKLMYPNAGIPYEPSQFPNSLEAMQAMEGSYIHVGNSYYKLGSYIRGGNYSRSYSYGGDQTTISTELGLPAINLLNDLGFSDGSYRSIQALYYIDTTSPTLPINDPAPDSSLDSALNSPSLDQLYELDNLMRNNPDAVQLPPNFERDYQTASDDYTTSQDPSFESDIDGDGIPDSEDPDADGDGIPNSEDPDSDGDGVPDADVPPDDEIEITNPELPSLHSVDLSPLLNIGNAIIGKFPFSLLSTVSSMATSLLSSPVAPVFTIHFPSPFDYDWVVSLERWDSWASLFRFLIGSAFLVSISLAILRRWV